MPLSEDLNEYVKEVFEDTFETQNTTSVPDSTDIKLGNHAKKLDGVVLYADMSESTQLVDSKKKWFSAKVYKSYLYCAAKIIRKMNGTIVSYDGDRIMAVFVGGSKNTNAVKAGLKINYARLKIINPAIDKKHGAGTYTLNHTVGIDSGNLYVARTGIRGSNDLVWIDRSANHAAKLCELSNATPTWITKEVYDSAATEAKFTDGKSMWVEKNWTKTGRTVYCSTWHWKCD